MKTIHDIWAPIIAARHNHPDIVDEGGDESDTTDDEGYDDVILPDLVDEGDDDAHLPAQVSHITMVELSEDESGIMGRLEYWREKDSIYGSCGLESSTHDTQM